MKHYFFITILSIFILSCGSQKRTASKKTIDKRTETVTKPQPEIEPAEPIITQPTPQPPEVIQPELPKPYDSNEKYIAVFSNKAQEEMRVYGIPASITLAQGILESASGKGRLAVEANNHFGIKCHDWQGERIYHDDDKSQECFRKYKTALTSFDDHSKFLANRKRYSKLFKLPKDDYKSWAKGLKAAGYATDKKYPDKLISLIERYQLYTYDAEVLGTTIVDNKHIVLKGDTLYNIAKRYSLTVEKLKALNNLKDNSIHIGQVLIVEPL